MPHRQSVLHRPSRAVVSALALLAALAGLAALASRALLPFELMRSWLDALAADGSADVYTREIHRRLFARGRPVGLALVALGALLVVAPRTGTVAVARLLAGRPPRGLERGCLMLCMLVFLTVATIHGSVWDYRDTAFFGGDTWEYQSLGVNLALGHGLRFGGIEPFETYRFEPMTPEPHYKKEFLRAREPTSDGSISSQRAPGYPAFLAVVYRIAGIHPAAAKQVQALLLILVASFLPYLGLRFWHMAGLVGGVVAMPVVLRKSLPLADDILTESLIVFWIFVITLAHLRWARVRSRGALFLLGLSVGLGLLVKASLILVPAVYVGYLLWSGRHARRSAVAASLLVFLGGVAVPVLPYSVFASLRSGQVVFVSTQGPAVVLDGNNELAVRTGTWEPGWRGRPESFFYREDVRALPVPVQVLRFYRAHPADLFRALPLKVDQAFGLAFFLRLLYLILIVVSLLELLAGIRTLKGRAPLAVAPAAVAVLALGAWITLGRVDGARLLLLTALVFLPACYLRPRLRELLPVPLLVFFANFLLLTLVTFGHRRFTEVMDFWVILTASALAIWACTEGLRRLGWDVGTGLGPSPDAQASAGSGTTARSGTRPHGIQP